MLSRRFKGYKHELHKYYRTFNSHDEACEKPFNDVSNFKIGNFVVKSLRQTNFKDDGESVGPIEFWKKTHYTEKGWKTPMAQQLYPSPMTEDEIYKEVMDKKLGYARGRGYGEIGSSSSIAKRIRVEELQEAREKATNAEKRASELAQHTWLTAQTLVGPAARLVRAWSYVILCVVIYLRACATFVTVGVGPSSSSRPGKEKIGDFL
ncbi:hypothetical protein Scep_011657 [Stephania cephalantha]|uniref:Uncharacterized protein n=1 Tax=Stephania cephalantha TaxID=152367 RepID=A0AAP0P6Q2_9MAGN